MYAFHRIWQQLFELYLTLSKSEINDNQVWFYQVMITSMQTLCGSLLDWLAVFKVVNDRKKLPDLGVTSNPYCSQSKPCIKRWKVLGSHQYSHGGKNSKQKEFYNRSVIVMGNNRKCVSSINTVFIRSIGNGMLVFYIDTTIVWPDLIRFNHNLSCPTIM